MRTLICFFCVLCVTASLYSKDVKKGDLRFGSNFSFTGAVFVKNSEPTFWTPLIDGFSLYCDAVRGKENYSLIYGGSAGLSYSQGIHALARFGWLKTLFIIPQDNSSIKIKLLTSAGLGVNYALYVITHSEAALEYSFNEKNKIGMYADAGIMLNTGLSINVSDPNYYGVVGYFISSGFRF